MLDAGAGAVTTGRLAAVGATTTCKLGADEAGLESVTGALLSTGGAMVCTMGAVVVRLEVATAAFGRAITAQPARPAATASIVTACWRPLMSTPVVYV